MHTAKPLALMLIAPLALVCACTSKPAAEPAPAPTPAPAEEPAEPKPEVQPDSDSAEHSDDRSARRQAVIDLLTDGDSASSLPIRATDPGQKFDVRLADR